MLMVALPAKFPRLFLRKRDQKTEELTRLLIEMPLG
jgi:hypothetical protein